MSIIIFGLLFILISLLSANSKLIQNQKVKYLIFTQFINIISIIDKIKAVNQNSENTRMRAIYKNHMGFEHLNTLQPSGQIRNPQASNANMNFSSIHSGSHEYASVLSSKNIPVEDTSTKKYPNNKYYQFNDEDSSGRKFLKEKLNLYADQSFHNPQPQVNQSYRDIRIPEESTRAKKAVSFSICVNDQSSINQNCQQQYKKVCKQKRQELNQKIKNKKYEEYKRFFKPKQNCNSSTIQSSKIKSSIKSHSKQKNNKKVSTSISTMETKQRKMCKSNFNSSRVIENAENQDPYLNQLKHYKKLCLNMRKKNTQLTKQLMQCKQENRKSIFELQKKIDKISEKYISKKQHNENEKTAKIMESLKSIKGKLNNKQNAEDKEARKFYQFFTQSIDILKSDRNQNLSSLQIKVIWKQMLQYLINHNYKIGQNSKVKSLR